MRVAATLFATGIVLVTSLTSGCDDETASRHSALSDAPDSRISTFRGPYGPYYIRPNQHHSGTPPPDPALEVQAPDLGDGSLSDSGDALTEERPISKPPKETSTLDQGFDNTPRKFQPPPQPEATPYSMSRPSPTPSSHRFRPLRPPAFTVHPGTSDERRMAEEQKRRTILFSQPDSTTTDMLPAVGPSPAAFLPNTSSTPSVP